MLLTGCGTQILVLGFPAAGADTIIKSKELLTESKCEWRCYKKKK